MRRDSIFYRLFAQFPQLLFGLLENPPDNAAAYRFDSVGVKEPRFEIDGVFLPPEDASPGTVFFVEVQFQKDQRLYERLFGESFLYFYRNRERFSNWQAIVIYPSRSTEQDETAPYDCLLESSHMHRIYLDELGEVQDLPLEASLMVLTTLTGQNTTAQARSIVARCQQSQKTEAEQRAIIEMVTTIMIYRFTNLSRQEVRAMLGITEVRLEDTRFYQEVKAEGREEGLQEGLQEGRQEGLQEGRQVALGSMLVLQLTQKFGPLDERLTAPIPLLVAEQLEELALNLLNYNQIEEFDAWLHSALRACLVTQLAEKFEVVPEVLSELLQERPLPLLTALAQELDELETPEVLRQWLIQSATSEP